MDSFANARAVILGKPKYFIGINVKHHDPAKAGTGHTRQLSNVGQGFGNNINNNVAALGALRNPAKLGGGVPQPGTGTIYGNGNGKGGTVPGFGYGKSGFGKGVNLPGGDNSNSVKTVPGFDNIGNGPGVNVPGDKDNHPGPNTKIGGLIGDQSEASGLLNSAGKGPQENIPTQSSNGVQSSDLGDGFKGAINDIGRAITDLAQGRDTMAGSKGGQADSPKAGGSSGSSGGSSQPTTSGQGEKAKPSAATTAAVNEVLGGFLAGVKKDTSNMKPSKFSDPKQMPGDDSTGGSVDANAGLAIGNAISQRNNGGGTGNNSEAITGGLGAIDPSSAANKKNNGDGAGGNNDDNYKGDDFAALSSGAIQIQQVDDGDGRGSRVGARALSQAKAN
jgi:hypothetical protein